MIVDTKSLFNEAIVAHRACQSALKDALLYAKVAGDKLTEAKRSLPHGAWLPQLEAFCTDVGISRRTANIYMQIAEGWEMIEASENLSYLSLDAAIKILRARNDLTALPEPKAIKPLTALEVGDRVRVVGGVGHPYTEQVATIVNRSGQTFFAEVFDPYQRNTIVYPFMASEIEPTDDPITVTALNTKRAYRSRKRLSDRIIALVLEYKEQLPSELFDKLMAELETP